MMNNVLTVNLEDYYHVTAFSANHGSLNGDLHVSRVEQNTDRTLEILAQNNCLATFFALRSVAEKFPQLIQRIVRAGHDIACHSFAHRQVFTLTRAQFFEDTRRAKVAIENAGGTAVIGYRAPSFSITKDSEWAFEVLAELGFTYASSIFPIRHLNFDMQDAPRSPFFIATSSGSILEFPMTTIQIAGTRAPLAGGVYLRALPYWYTRWGIRHLNTSECRPACVYLHPWELDPEQPRMQGNLTGRMRHYFGLQGAESKFRRLLKDFEFQPLRILVEELNIKRRKSRVGNVTVVPVTGGANYIGSYAARMLPRTCHARYFEQHQHGLSLTFSLVFSLRRSVGRQVPPRDHEEIPNVSLSCGGLMALLAQSKRTQSS